MTDPDDQDDAEEGQPTEIPVPFLDKAVGLGDVIEKITRTFGVKPCGDCKGRKGRANRRYRFVPRSKK